jgi:predicted MFS family arabinose efflux permease
MGYLADQTSNHVHQQLRNRLIQGVLYVAIAILMAGQFKWTGFIIVLSLSIIVSLIGSYNTYGAIPIIKDIVKPSDIPEAEGFESGINSTISLTGGLIGASLLSLFQYQYSLFAFLNAISFFSAFWLLFHSREYFLQLPCSHVKIGKTYGMFNNCRKFLRKTQANFTLLKKESTIVQFIKVFMAINLFDSGQGVLLNLSFAHEQKLLFINYGYTVALLGMVESVGSIVGSLLPGRITRYFSISICIISIYVAYGLLALNIIFFKGKILLLVLTVISSILIGILNPIVQGKMINELPKESIGSIISAFYTVVQLTVPLGSMIFATMANTLSLQVSWISLFLFNLVTLLLWILLQRKQITI